MQTAVFVGLLGIVFAIPQAMLVIPQYIGTEEKASFLLISTADSVSCLNDQPVKILIKYGNLDVSCEAGF